MKELINLLLAIIYAIFPFLLRFKTKIPPVTDWPIFEDFRKMFPGKGQSSMTFDGSYKLSPVHAKLKYNGTSAKVVITEFSKQDWAFNTIILELSKDVPENATIDVDTQGSSCNTYHFQLPWNTRIHALFTDVTPHQLNELASIYGFNVQGHFADKTLLLQISNAKGKVFWLPISLDEKHNEKLADWDELIVSSFAQQNKPITLKGLGVEFNVAREIVDSINTKIKEHPIEMGTGKNKKFLQSLRISTFKKSIDTFLIKPHYTKVKSN